MKDLVMHFLPTIEHFSLLGYWVLFIISLAESLAFVGILVPGTTIILLAGFLASKGIFDLGDLIWFVTVGAIVGDGLSFYLGKRGKQLVHRESKLFNISRMEKAEAFFQHHGGKSVFLGRFFGPMRAVIPFIAGMARMNLRLFVLWNVSSAFAWAIAYLLLGYFFGHAWQAIETWSTRVSVFLVILFLGAIGLYWIKRLIVKNGRQVFMFLYSIGTSVFKAVRENPDVQILVRRYPRFFDSLRSRFQSDRFSGLTLSLLVVAFLYTLALFFGVIEDLLMADSIVGVDVRLQNLLYVFRSPELVEFFLWITLLGKSVIIISAALVVSILFWINRQRLYILPFWLVLAGSTIFNVLGKLAFHRPRPELSVYTEHSFSFPSGHATIAVAFYGFLTYILWKHTTTWTRKVNALFLGMGVIVAIGFSRLYLGVHFLSDVWGGYLLGTLWLIIGISFMEWFRTRQGRSLVRPFFPSNPLRVLSGLLILAELWGYAALGLYYAPPPKIPIDVVDKRLPKDVTTVFSENQLPKYTETLTGRAQEPLTLLLLVQNDTQLIEVFRQAGWYSADQISPATIVMIAKAALFNTEYFTAPITPYFWNARPHDFGFQKPTEALSVRKRHHARFWRTRYVTVEGKRLYVGTASFDAGIKWGFTHKIAPDIDTERDLVVADFRNAGLIDAIQHVKFVEPTLGQNAFGDLFFTNGISYIMVLKAV